MHAKDSQIVGALLDWAENPEPSMFPYALTLRAVHRRGKHFIAPEVLDALDQARCCVAGIDHGDVWLTKFLDVVLDKHDQKYDYLSYTALPLLEHIRPDVTAAANTRRLQYVHDCTTCSLLGDVLRFELNTLEDGESYLAEMPPERELLERRINCTLRALAPGLQRLGFDEPLLLGRQTRRVVQFCSAQSLAFSQFVLDGTMLPVYTSHDEYLFLRILQTLDMTFISVSSLLRCALYAFEDELPRVAHFIRSADAILQEGLRHFQTLSTMQKESFRTFREFTTGASAIQSVNYKLMESLCRTPDKDRLESIAYGSVPSLRKELQAGNVSLDDKLLELRGRRGAEPDVIPDIEAAMHALSETMTRWRYSHFGIAKKYLGEGTGTGYTAGTPYLKSIKDLPVFTSLSSDRAPVSA